MLLCTRCSTSVPVDEITACCAVKGGVKCSHAYCLQCAGFPTIVHKKTYSCSTAPWFCTNHGGSFYDDPLERAETGMKVKFRSFWSFKPESLALSCARIIDRIGPGYVSKMLDDGVVNAPLKFRNFQGQDAHEFCLPIVGGLGRFATDDLYSRLLDVERRLPPADNVVYLPKEDKLGLVIGRIPSGCNAVSNGPKNHELCWLLDYDDARILGELDHAELVDFFIPPMVRENPRLRTFRHQIMKHYLESSSKGQGDAEKCVRVWVNDTVRFYSEGEAASEILALEHPHDAIAAFHVQCADFMRVPEFESHAQLSNLLTDKMNRHISKIARDNRVDH